MIVIIRKRHLAMAAAAVLAVCVLAYLLWQPVKEAHVLAADTVVVDAGHGGADGGAVASDGTAESGINLAITVKIQEILLFLGQDVTLTRTDDQGLYNDDSVTIRQKKVADTHNRVDLINGVDGAVLISIHQNALPSSPRTHGAQVFYNAVSPAQELAGSIQQALNGTVNVGNAKAAAAIPGSVYIMANVRCPGVLVECGFLSNAEETKLLQTATYQQKLALAIVCGYLSYEG